MKNAIILHGTLGSPQGNWFQWLKAELEKQNVQVWLPELPNSHQPSLKEWATFVYQNAPFKINQETLIVGHSSGAILALILVQQNRAPIGAVAAVSVFHDNSLRWEPNSKLFDVPFDWQIIQQNVQRLFFVHSDNDSYVPQDQAEYVAKNCNAPIIIMPGQGHFNLEQSPDYKMFPKLLELLRTYAIIAS